MPICTTGAGSVGAFVPTAPAGAAFAVAVHPTLCRSDAGNTTPCNPGDAIQWWYEFISATWYQQATSGSRFIMRQDATSKKYYAEAGPSRTHRFGWTPNQNANGNTFTYGASVTNIASTYGAFFGVGTSSNGYKFGCGNADFTANGTNLVNLTDGAAWYVQGADGGGGRYMYESSTNATNVVMSSYVNGTGLLLSQSISLGIAPTVPVSIGYDASLVARTLQSGNIWGICGYTSISSGNRTTVDNWLKVVAP